MKRIIALAALILFATTGTAQAKADDPKDACKHGGFSQYVDPATGQPFTSQSPCVSFVAQGGTLVPVPPPVVALPVITLTSSPFHPEWGTYEVTVNLEHAPLGEFGILRDVDIVAGNQYFNTIPFGPDGTGRISVLVAPGTEVTVAYNGTIVARLTPPLVQ